MHISRQIGYSHVEQMELIADFILHFDVDRLLYAINGKELDESEIKSLTYDISDQNNKLARQKEHLFKFGRIFNKEWTTDDNMCFDSSIKVSRRIRSGTKGVKQVIGKFCKISRRQLRPGQDEPQAINVSMISSKYYVADLFGLASYPDCVKKLFYVMLEFYDNLDDCIHEAMRVLAEEKSIKQNERKCLDLLIQACEKSRKNQLHIIEAMERDPEFKAALMKTASLTSDDVNPVLKAWKNSKKEELFAVAYFHNCSPKDVGKITLHRTMLAADNDPELMKCMTIFGCKKDKAIKILSAIKQFDSLLTEKCKRGKIPAMSLFVFMRWCSDGVGYQTFLNYFNERYLAAGGKWDTITASALNGVSKKKKKQREKFEKVEKELLSKLCKKFPDKTGNILHE